MTKEEMLKKAILSNYKSLRDFTIKSDIPYSTVNAILKRGIDNSSISNVSKICHVLQISVDELIYNNKIVPINNSAIKKEKSINLTHAQQIWKYQFKTTAEITLDDQELTDREKSFFVQSIDIVIEQLRKNREKRNEQ